ncbi:hypothetical protein P22_1716 [Propionispora sp. 2/2-37]|uniref:GNAT family N-acetyltransferase n=1 Tax=Propionispora sp. 2/2-37 TaxID=1677858 RepID=UPI0006C2D04E|nr:GNAT family N-acetyltransferase [Propionispora sp. 2/2-37]CUH95642.1 hypothetical protein P22_1716 [Propionispora sp. 2/2-37]
MSAMDKHTVLNIVKEQLSKKLNCSIDAFDKDGTLFIANDQKEYPFLEIITMGKSVIISASSNILPKVKPLLVEKSRDEIFEFPFIYGQSIYFIPDSGLTKELPLIVGYEYELLKGEEIKKLKGITGFQNSLAFDEKGHTSTVIVLYAMRDNEIIGLAGASAEYEQMWEMGVDVKPQYRKCGLATRLIYNLAVHILKKEIVPFYCASTTNIGSQMVAYRSGFIPCWISTYRNILDGSSSYNDIVKNIVIL